MCLICEEFEARLQTLQNVGVGAREKWRKEGRREEMRRGVNRKLETSVPALELRLRRKVTNLPFILNFAAGAKTSVCFQKFSLNLIINK